MRHHAFVIEAEAEEGIRVAQAWAEKELGMEATHSTSFNSIQDKSLRAGSNPDFVVLRYGLFSVEDARRVSELAASAPFEGESKVLVIAASRAYHEAQNSLLKLFEEPPPNTYLFLVLPTLGGILPTLRSRVQVLKHQAPNTKSQTSTKSETNTKHEINSAEEFLKATKEKRSVMIKKIAAHQDGDAVSAREEALAIVNGVEAVAYMSGRTTSRHRELLEDIQILRGYLHDRSAPVRMILEHVSMIIPKDLI